MIEATETEDKVETGAEKQAEGRDVIEAAQTEERVKMGAEEEKEQRDMIKAAETESKTAGSICAELLQKRQPFHPFSDNEITDCVQIMPGDIVRLQQDNWQVGRSSFLQHGYYQYRHLLMGRMADGTYVLGVPGIRNQQENYMAQMFGFDHFKMSRICDCGRAFGYWWRPLARR